MMKHPDKRKRLQTRPLPMGKKSRVFLAVYSENSRSWGTSH